MTTNVAEVASYVGSYAARLHAVAGPRHHVASPLGAWLLLALAGRASAGPDRAALAAVLGCEPDAAAGIAADLLADPHPAVAAAVAAWTAPGVRGRPSLDRWLRHLPAAVTQGDLPSQAQLDAWAREHTFGLISRFPLDLTADLVLVLASALATRVSWTVPFDLAPAESLGSQSRWPARVSQVLRTPERSGGAHAQYVAATQTVGDVIVHAARAADGLLVVSVAAEPDQPQDAVLAVAHDLAVRQAAGVPVQRRSLSELPLGDQPLWLAREITAAADRCAAVLPAWSADTRLDLTEAGLGFAAASRALLPGGTRWAAQQSATARYSRTGFEAAAVTGFAIAIAARLPGARRDVELRFAHPFAVVAVCARDDAGPGRSWTGLPVFSAWVTEPEDPAEASDGEGQERL